MNVLVFDTETTGFVAESQPPTSAAQPDLVQLGAILFDAADNRIRGELNVIAQLDPGVRVPTGASSVHGITTEACAQYGIPLLIVMAAFNNLAKAADMFVCHNARFDTVVMQRAYHKVNRPHPFADKPVMCTMEAATPIIRVPPTEKMLRAGRTHWKKPNLQEAYGHVTGGLSFDGAHDAMADVRATLEVWKWLQTQTTSSVAA